MLKEQFEIWSARTGQTMGDAARIMGVGKSAISKWLSGQNKPRPRALKALADMLGMDPVAVLREFQSRDRNTP